MRFRRFPLYQYLDLRRLSPCLRFSTSIRRRLICCGLFSVSVAYLPVIVSLYALRRRSILDPAIVAAFLKGGLNPSRHSVHSSLTKLLFKHFISLSGILARGPRRRSGRSGNEDAKHKETQCVRHLSRH